MPENISLKELDRQILTFPGPDVPLSGLRTALEAVEEELAHACEQATIRLHARHKREMGLLDPEGRDLDLYELEATVEQLLPRIFRGGFVLTLWSVFEVVSKRMAEYGYCELNPKNKLNFRPQQGQTFLDVLEKVYTSKLKILAFPDAPVREQLDQLRQIRNALIHNNGSVAALRKSLRASEIVDFAALNLQTYTALHEEFFVPTAEFLNSNLALVHSYLVSLSERVYVAVHPVPLNDTDSTSLPKRGDDRGTVG